MHRSGSDPERSSGRFREKRNRHNYKQVIFLMQFESSKNLICRTFKISVNQLLPQWSNKTHCKSN